MPGAYMESANFFSPYIKFILGFIGIKDVDILSGGRNDRDQPEAYLAEHTSKAVAALTE